MDRISTLPDNITEKILTLMPIRDALRTSILSRKWRYSWRSMPKLAFTDDMVKVHSSCPLLKKSLLVNAIFHVLLFHKGPTKLEFFSSFDDFQMFSEVDQIINYLSRGSSVNELILVVRDNYYKLPVSFFSLQGLESIELQNCVLEPPVTFNGFSRLRRIMFNNVKVSPQMLQRFFSECPLVEYISLIGYKLLGMDFAAGGSKFTFVDLLECVPLIQTLEISKYYMEFLSTGGMPHKLPTSLPRLKYLDLDMCLMEQNEISSTMCLIRSSPLLVKINIMMFGNEKLSATNFLDLEDYSTNFLDPEDYSDLNLNHLETLEIRGFSNLPYEMEFVKLIIAKSHVLKKVKIEFDYNVSIDEELKMIRDLAGHDEDIRFVTGGNMFTFVDLLQSVPLIKELVVSEDYVKCLSAGGMPHKLPTPLAYLKYLCLDVCLMYHNEVSSALCIIRSSPVLENLIIVMYGNEKLPAQKTPTNFFDPEDCSNLKLDHLETFKIEWFSNLPLEMEFVRLILAKSPVLKKVQLELNDNVYDDEELEMLRNLVRYPFPRASPSAQLIIERP
ncbi:hypothetical protein SSX86_027774 [Deinandra increscens subsp. villosa]|uniref:F-box domain-containing protein n=1 Tax=Deinandra increscens subsp. villosa TaxID=3103831 RepID=A0AAP0GIQ5_9ASTR